MPFFSRVFRRDGATKKNVEPSTAVAPPQPRWEEAWSRKEVAPEEVSELIRVCTQEMKSRALEMPFLLLPFRPGTDPVGAKNVIRLYFKARYEGHYDSKAVAQAELRLMEPIVLCSIMKWCWSRLPGGVVTWDIYELFRVGELDSNMSKNAFEVFIPISTDSGARKDIIFDFFDLLAAIAARGKTNGLGGRKLSRLAGWWAFSHSDNGNGFDGGYRSWAKAADATSHLFFAYLRALSPDSASGVSGISKLPRSLQALLSQTEYPPEPPSLMQTSTTKVVMIVQSVSPTPFSLLRRARNFEYRDDDRALQTFSDYEDPVKALTDECRRVLGCIEAINQSMSTANGNPVQDGAWSRFEDVGFNSLAETLSNPGDLAVPGEASGGLRTAPGSAVDILGRPTTPSWADFLNSGFHDDRRPGLLPPDKQLPLPVTGQRGHSSQSHRPFGHQADLEPGELASITRFDLDETFWWVWMTSLAGEEPPERKAVFGRCALIETEIPGGHWMVIEEQVKGASPGQDEGVYIAEKKSRFSFRSRTRMGRNKTTKKKKGRVEEPHERAKTATPASRIDPEQQAKIQEAAAQLAKGKQTHSEAEHAKRGRLDDTTSMKTNSILTLQPAIMREAAPALKWAKDFDSGGLREKDDIRNAYLKDKMAGTGQRPMNGFNGPARSPINGTMSSQLQERKLPDAPAATQTNGHKAAKSPSPPSTPPHRSTSNTREAEAQYQPPLLDEKPKPPAHDEHPALRSQDSPESAKAAPASKAEGKKKKETGGGFKKFLGRGKKTASRSNTGGDDHHPHKLQKSPRRIVEQPPREPTPEPALAPVEHSPPRENNEPTFTEPTLDDSHGARNQFSSRPDDHQVPLSERLEADREFSRFDQGPLDDVPAFIPEESPEHSPVRDHSPAPAPPNFSARATALLASPTDTEMTAKTQTTGRGVSPAPRAAPDNQSDVSEETPMPATDRWAQIRKNAAERAQRMNEEHNHGRSRSQSGRTDDGETSGEETIESRVARIKARVAELTGNMDAPGNAGRR